MIVDEHVHECRQIHTSIKSRKKGKRVKTIFQKNQRVAGQLFSELKNSTVT